MSACKRIWDKVLDRWVYEDIGEVWWGSAMDIAWDESHNKPVKCKSEFYDNGCKISSTCECNQCERIRAQVKAIAESCPVRKSSYYKARCAKDGCDKLQAAHSYYCMEHYREAIKKWGGLL